jgi:hypothetical protein
MRFIRFALAASCSLLAQVSSLSPKEISDGWLLLFDGESTFAWSQAGPAKWKAANATLAPDGAADGWLHTNTQFGDFILKFEFQASANANSAVLLRARKVPDSLKSGYEFKLAGHARPKWHACEITAIGPRILVKLDGKKVLDVNDSKSAAGFIGLQSNRNQPVQFRNIRLRPLGLAPIFNGKNLSGWQKVQPPKPPAQPAEWTVKKGAIHVLKGPGQLETKAQFDDFVLQLDIRANSADPKFHPNSGIFFRGKPNGYWTGYEIQIRNEFKDNDRSKPVDTGSGGLYFHQPARRVIPSDNQFYTQTVIAHGRHISTWINGFPVADFEDPHPEGDAGPRNKQALLKPGPISLQAHDPKTNLDFKDIRIKSLGK